MVAILGIDAAWTEHEPSGVALLAGEGDRWTCVAVAPSYQSFIGLARGVPVDWRGRIRASDVPPVDDLVGAATQMAGSQVQIVAVDMPMSLAAISGRRPADDLVSREFGNRHCSAHSPGTKRPGSLGARLTADLKRLGFSLATASVPLPAGRTLLEVYPHTALLSLLEAERRVAYKVSKSSRLWPKQPITARIAELLKVFRTIQSRLDCELGRLPFDIPATAASLSALKPYEDALDAVVSAWMATRYLQGQATPLGDEQAAVWVPSDTIRTSGPACPLCRAVQSGALIAANRRAASFFDGFPVSPGHALIVSRRHCGNLFQLSDAEQHAIWQLLPAVKAAVEQRHSPSAYNVGVNIGRDAGQTVDHVHVHVIPRYQGDVEDPRGGVRWVLPAKADYWSTRP